MIDADKAIAAAVKTGKVVFGAKEASRTMKTGRAQLVIFASNTPSRIRNDLEYLRRISTVPVEPYRGNTFDLGRACGKPCAVAVLTIREPGDSDILKLAKRVEGEEEGATLSRRKAEGD